MSHAYEIFLTGNADLFREGLNAVAAVCHSTDFQTFVWMGNTGAIMATVGAYIKQRDPLIFVKWMATYVFVFSVLLGTSLNVVLINTSDPSSSPKQVDSVPTGVALPAHIITSIAHSFLTQFETAFALPRELQYGQTGMLFAANLFRLSLGARLNDTVLLEKMERFWQNCVVPDMLINYKYSAEDLLNSPDVWGLMTSAPSKIRGVFLPQTGTNPPAFKTCAEAAPLLTDELDNYVKARAPALLAGNLHTRQRFSGKDISRLLEGSYAYLRHASKSATDILKQNISASLFRQSLWKSAAEEGSDASAELAAKELALASTRMAWKTSGHIGVETLPLMQIIMLLLLFCVFPLIAVLALIPGLGGQVLKNYVASIVWLETWPFLYAVLNMALHFYVAAGPGGPVTMDNMNALAQEHADIQGIAGYLILAIPFLSFGLVKGMAYTFNNAAQYLGGMMHSVAQSSASAATLGNYSMGNISAQNTSLNNLNANKYDDNFSHRSGLISMQNANATMGSIAPDGSMISHLGGGMSSLASTPNFSSSISAAHSRVLDRAVQEASNFSAQADQRWSHGNADDQRWAKNQGAGISQARSKLLSATSQVAANNGISKNEAISVLSQASASGSVGFDAHGIAKVRVGVDGHLSSSQRSSSDQGQTISFSRSDMEKFQEGANAYTNYAKAHTASESNSALENAAIGEGNSLQLAHRAAENRQYTESHAASINMNKSQDFAAWVQREDPENAREILSATSGHWLSEQQKEVQKFEGQEAARIQKSYGLPNQSELDQKLGSNFSDDASALIDAQKNLGPNHPKNAAFRRTTEQSLSDMGPALQEEKTAMRASQKTQESNLARQMAEGRTTAQKSLADLAAEKFPPGMAGAIGKFEKIL